MLMTLCLSKCLALSNEVITNQNIRPEPFETPSKSLAPSKVFPGRPMTPRPGCRRLGSYPSALAPPLNGQRSRGREVASSETELKTFLFHTDGLI